MLLHVIVWMGGERGRRKGESRGGKGREGVKNERRGGEGRGGEGREKGFKGREWHYRKTITIIFLHSKPSLQTKSVLYALCQLNRFLPVCQSNPTEINLSKALWGNRWLPEWLQDGIHEAGVPQVEETSCTHGTGVTILGEREVDSKVAGCSCRSDIYLRECGHAHILIHWSSPHKFFCVINFRSWSQPRNYYKRGSMVDHTLGLVPKLLTWELGNEATVATVQVRGSEPTKWARPRYNRSSFSLWQESYILQWATHGR